MPRIIPALKSPPEIVPKLVTILYDYTDRREEIDRRMTEVLRGISNASPRNLLRAYAAPTLNNLGLAVGAGKAWRCSPDGESLALAYQYSDDEGLKRFGYILYQRDEKDGLQVITELQRQGADKTPVSRRRLAESLFSRYKDELVEQDISIKILSDRLAKWLGYLQHVRFVDYVENDAIRLYPFEVETALTGEESSWELNEFKNGLVASYKSLRAEHPAIVYVPLPDLRQRMYEMMFKRQRRTFSTAAFDEALRKLPKATDEYVILLSPPGSQSGGGIRIGDKYYYYISIHPHDEENRDHV
jgi:hypothetical protein